MWNRLLLAAITMLQIQPALGADKPSANTDGAALRLYQFRDGALLLKPEYGAADKPVASLVPSEWAVAYQARGDAGITPRLRREGVYRWTETQVKIGRAHV